MKWASAVSENANLEEAIQECAARVLSELGEAAPDLAVTFVSTHHEADYDIVSGLVKTKAGAGKGIWLFSWRYHWKRRGNRATPRRVDNRCLFARGRIVDFHLDGDSLPDLDAGPASWEELVQVSKDQDPQFVMLADPFSFPVENLLMGLDFAFTQSAKIGGLASGANQQGGNALFLSDCVYRFGRYRTGPSWQHHRGHCSGPGVPPGRRADANYRERTQPAGKAGRATSFGTFERAVSVDEPAGPGSYAKLAVPGSGHG